MLDHEGITTLVAGAKCKITKEIQQVAPGYLNKELFSLEVTTVIRIGLLLQKSRYMLHSCSC